ncbi:hypothetical protein [Blastococcus sp. SYSU DS0539]
MTGPDLPLVDADADQAAVLADLLAAGHGDGLPVVPPTASRLREMLAGVGAPDAELGLVPPLFGALTVRAVAWYAVLAGCRPAELPVVVSACRAALDDSFNLLGISTTTGAPAVAVLVHGPVAARLGMTSGAGGLGTGNRANACIGRAVSMALAGIGGATAGLTDMATIGSPAKYTCCTAEAARPLPSLAQRRGWGVDVDAVTVIGAGATVEVLPGENYRQPPSVLGPAAAAMAGVVLASGEPARGALGEQFLLLPPEPAELLAMHGWGHERIGEFLFEQGSALLQETAASLAFRAGVPAYAVEGLTVAGSPADVHVVVTGGAGVKMLLLPTWMGGSRSVTAPVLPVGSGAG